VDSNQLFETIHNFCISNADEAIVKKYSRYFKEGYPGYGVPGALFEEKVREIKSYPGISLELLMETAPLLIRTGRYEETTFAIRLTLGFSRQFTKVTFHETEKWFSLGITNWAHTDYFCGDVMKIFFKKGIINLTDLSDWRTAKNKYQRRAVPVSLIKELKTTPDFTPFLSFIDPMMTDQEREVHQGLGWFLRVAWKSQPDPVEAFLLKWKDTSARLIFQYATEKMTKEQKERFRRRK
jgi:3-methyladenine DNA glycosylase AlkD